MAKHIHAEMMMQYAQDAMETPRPWERWEWYVPAIKSWETMPSSPDWNTRTEYRRKPKMISVTLANGEVVSWPEPHRAELDKRDAYYYVDVDGSVMGEKWHGIAWDRGTLSNGGVHLTKEAAEQHAAALHKINTQGD